MEEHSLLDISSGIAAFILKKHLANGGIIEIPSLGITIGRKPMLDLEAIKARESAATKGPWVDTDPLCVRHAEPNIYMGDEEIADVYTRSDSIFIAHAREDIPNLIAEVERLQRIEAAARVFKNEWESGGNTAMVDVGDALWAALEEQ